MSAVFLDIRLRDRTAVIFSRRHQSGFGAESRSSSSPARATSDDRPRACGLSFPRPEAGLVRPLSSFPLLSLGVFVDSCNASAPSVPERRDHQRAAAVPRVVALLPRRSTMDSVRSCRSPRADLPLGVTGIRDLDGANRAARAGVHDRSKFRLLIVTCQRAGGWRLDSGEFSLAKSRLRAAQSWLPSALPPASSSRQHRPHW